MAPKNKKAEKMSLGDFLGDQSLGSWADEMEDAPMPRAGGFGGASYGGGSDRPSYGGGSAFGASRTDSFADRGFATREQLPLPSKPPYTAHLGNLSFDATEGDVNDFFADCEVTNVRIVEDKLDRKPKGFGYVEFGSLDGLKKALDLSGTQFQGRNVRVSVAEPPKDRPEARDISDWSRKGPLPDLPGRGYNSSRGGGGFDAGSDAGGERRRPAFESDGKPRDFGNWERRGPLSPSAEGPREGGRRFDGPREPREGGFRERQSPAWGEGRPEGAPRREFQPVEGRPQFERQPTAADQDNQWRSKMRPDAASPTGTPDASTPSSPAPLASRPKLNLAKRTVSEAPTASAATPSDKPNPFGAARPIDTAAREREVEEKQKQAAQQKKEAEDKAREEKKAKEAAAKDAAATKSTEESTGEDVPKTVENPEAKAKDEDDANGAIVDDKNVKPQEPVVAPKDGGSWRRKSSTPAAAAAAAAPASTTETMDEDGWSTVTKAPKNARNNRRGGAPSRAIAS